MDNSFWYTPEQQPMYFPDVLKQLAEMQTVDTIEYQPQPEQIDDKQEGNVLTEHPRIERVTSLADPNGQKEPEVYRYGNI